MLIWSLNFSVSTPSRAVWWTKSIKSNPMKLRYTEDFRVFTLTEVQRRLLTANKVFSNTVATIFMILPNIQLLKRQPIFLYMAICLPRPNWMSLIQS